MEPVSYYKGENNTCRSSKMSLDLFALGLFYLFSLLLFWLLAFALF